MMVSMTVNDHVFSHTTRTFEILYRKKAKNDLLFALNLSKHAMVRKLGLQHDLN